MMVIRLCQKNIIFVKSAQKKDRKILIFVIKLH